MKLLYKTLKYHNNKKTRCRFSSENDTRSTVNGGAWTFATAALADGAHSFSAKATDNAGKAVDFTFICGGPQGAPGCAPLRRNPLWEQGKLIFGIGIWEDPRHQQKRPRPLYAG
jgi:hypothetical protein